MRRTADSLGAYLTLEPKPRPRTPSATAFPTYAHPEGSNTKRPAAPSPPSSTRPGHWEPVASGSIRTMRRPPSVVVTRAARRGRLPAPLAPPRTATPPVGISLNNSCHNSRAATVNVRFVRSPEMLHYLAHDGLMTTAGNGKTAGQKPVTCGFTSWPGAGSNRRPSDFHAEASVAGFMRMRDE